MLLLSAFAAARIHDWLGILMILGGGRGSGRFNAFPLATASATSMVLTFISLLCLSLHS
jgi:hypothetical protein